MKDTRKILSVVLSLVMILTALPLTAVSSFAELEEEEEYVTCGDFEYYVISEEEKTCEISEYKGSASNLEIPSELDEYSVVEIGWSAFEDCTTLTNVLIPEGVTTVGGWAFCYCTSLASITIPDSVTYIGNYAFCACTSLTSIDVDEANEIYCSVNGILFSKDKTELSCYPAGKTDTSYIIPDSVTSIGWNAFYGCTTFTSITIPDSVTSIGYDAFCDCYSLASVLIPDSITSIGEYAFYNTAYYNNSDNWENGVLYIGHHLIDTDTEYDWETDTFITTVPSEYSIKDGTLTIADDAFYYCESLTSVTIPGSVTSIGDWAFCECNSLTSITIPDSVTSIGEYAFYHCESLTNITIPDSVISIGESAFGYYWNDETEEYEKIESFTIYGHEGTEAERYANDNGFTFIALEKEPIIDPADVNGDSKITVVDAKWTLQAVANSRTLTAEQMTAADVNGDGKVTVVDAKWILQAVAGMRDLAK